MLWQAAKLNAEPIAIHTDNLFINARPFLYCPCCCPCCCLCCRQSCPLALFYRSGHIPTRYQQKRRHKGNERVFQPVWDESPDQASFLTRWMKK
ncbi:predicted protein [Brucella melitensis bv. 2 str. 63/9]|nr:predicted protein [Brucella melitensis bv. 2 str. 63/9]